MLPQIFPSYPYSADQGWTGENSGSTLVAQCCSSQYFMQYFELQSDRKMAHHLFLPRSLHRPPEAPGTVGGPSMLPSSPPPVFPNGHPPIEDPAQPVGTVRRPPWSMAIAICPTGINSPRPLRGFNSPERVDRVSFSVAMLTVSTLILAELLAIANGSSAHWD